MQSVPREWLDFLRQQFPKDSRIQLTEIGGNPRPISPGSTGKLDYIDDAGQFHVKWDNGCTLALVLGEDRFSVYLPEPQTFKLYMPLTADFYGRDEWGDMSEDGEEWDGHTLMDYEGQILSALVKNRVPEENESGLMHWYGEDDSVDHKVRSAVFTVEVRNRQLWGVAECRVAGELTPEELTILKEYLGGQASDGWGEGFEQRPIEVDGGELYVHLWQPDDWSIQTEQERFAPKVAEGLPELCFSTLRTTGQLICIKRGETGYYPSDWDTGDKEGNVELADELNEDLGVTPIQRQAIIQMPHPTSTKHPRMSLSNRATQFSPFAALSGHSAALAETARLTDQEIELTEDLKAVLDQKQRNLLEHIKEHPKVTVTWFQPDEKKDGGQYITTTGYLKRIDEFEKVLRLTNGIKIPLIHVVDIGSEELRDMTLVE